MYKFLPIVLLIFFTQVQAGTLCEPKSNTDELDMAEDDFNFESAHKSIGHAQECILIADTTLSFEKQIGCINSLAIVEGTLLKQNALLLELRYQSTQQNKDKNAYEQAVKKFCTFVNEAEYVD